MKKVNLLSRAEMKNVMGGDQPATGEIGGHGALECTTPNGTETWYRPNCNPSDAIHQCKLIYPAYGANVSGQCVIVITP